MCKGFAVLDSGSTLRRGEHRRVRLDSDDALGYAGPDARRQPGSAAQVDDERRSFDVRVAAQDLEQGPRRARAEAVVLSSESWTVVTGARDELSGEVHPSSVIGRSPRDFARNYEATPAASGVSSSTVAETTPGSNCDLEQSSSSASAAPIESFP